MQKPLLKRRSDANSQRRQNTMYEIHDNTERFHQEGLVDFERDLPEPLDHWTLRDFADIISIANYAS
jgi:hypothetical protein